MDLNRIKPEDIDTAMDLIGSFLKACLSIAVYVQDSKNPIKAENML